MPTVWMGGGEVAAHRTLLGREGVETIAVNLSAYFKQRQALQMSDAYDGFRIVLYSSEGGLDPRKVESFIDANAVKFDMIYGLQTTAPAFVPEWGGGDLHTFYDLASQHRSVGLTEAVALDSDLMPQISAFARREGIKLMTSSGKQEALSAVAWSDVIVSAWVTASKHRELQVWDGRIVKRYARLRRNAAIERHAAQISRMGVSLDDLINDDPDANLTLAVRSWKLWATGDNVVPLRLVVADSESPTGAPTDVAIADRHPSVYTKPVERQRILLPILGVQPGTEDDLDPSLNVRSKLLRVCDSCFIAQHCPGFQPHHECAFEIPVMIKTKADRLHATSMVMEIQMQRLLLSRTAEDVLSQGTDERTDAQIDRFMRVLKTAKELEETTESLTITARGSAHASAGRLSSIFGSHVGEANLQLPAPIESDALMAEILDGEVVGEPSVDS